MEFYRLILVRAKVKVLRNNFAGDENQIRDLRQQCLCHFHRCYERGVLACPFLNSES